MSKKDKPTRKPGSSDLDNQTQGPTPKRVYDKFGRLIKPTKKTSR